MPRPRNNDFTKDLFYFVRCDPGKGPRANVDEDVKNEEWKLKFEAHITNIHDSSSPSWETNFDMGRADPKLFYQSVNRSFSINFMVVALNKEEHDANHILLAKLGVLTYPIYQDGYGYNGVHVFYAIGGLMKGYGVITSLDYDWNADYPWMRTDKGAHRPLYTDVSLNIMKLADGSGYRPQIDKSNYFI